MTYPWSAGEILTATDLNAAIGDLGIGLVAVGTASSSDQTGISSITDVTGVSATFTAATGRYYVIEARLGSLFIVTTNGQIASYITNSSNTVLGSSNTYQTPIATANRCSMSPRTIPITFSAGSQTVKLRIELLSGSNLTVSNSEAPASIAVYDVGPT